MRIISGKFKGKPINFLKTKSIRPLKDSVKENIFNVLLHSNKINIQINNSNILDLYSGVGSFGLECLSRNAKKVAFVDYDKNAVGTLRKNLVKLSLIDKAELFNEKIEEFLEHNKDKFNIIFFDPPFKDKIFIENLKNIKKKKFFKKEHLVIIHRERKCMDNFSIILNIKILKEYRRSKIIFGTLD